MRRFAWILLLAASPAAAAELELRFLDVGQGDAVLLEHAGKAVLVDTGPDDSIVEQLRRHGVSSLELLVVSHNHADHFGGADALLAELPVRHYLDNDFPAKTKIQETVLRLVEARGVTVLQAVDRRIELDDLTLRILAPPAAAGGDEQNNRSVGVLVEHGGFRALLTGDSEVEEINAWLAAGSISDVDVLKAAHHGSRNGVTPAWLTAAAPELVVVSCGAGNSYGHPHEAALRYYATAGRLILRTDRDGEVLVRVPAEGRYAVEAARRQGPIVVPPPLVAAPVAAVVPAPAAAPEPRAPGCCRVCKTSKACGDSCISAGRTCKKPPGCACNAAP